jgi:integrase/recombinase XerD
MKKYLHLCRTVKEDSRAIGTRDAAVIAIMLGAGLRREEVTTSNFEDYDSEDAKLIVRGKRSKQRTAYLGDDAIAALNDWLELRGKGSGPLFLAVSKAGNLRYGRRLTPQAIYHLLRSRAKRDGVKSFTPHDLRRTFVSKLLNAGVDIAIVAKMAGHSNIQTTARYDRRPEAAKQRAAKLLQIPYTELGATSRGIKELPVYYRHHTYYFRKSAFS